jgi:hypothetical protein
MRGREDVAAGLNSAVAISGAVPPAMTEGYRDSLALYLLMARLDSRAKDPHVAASGIPL